MTTRSAPSQFCPHPSAQSPTLGAPCLVPVCLLNCAAPFCALRRVPPERDESRRPWRGESAAPADPSSSQGLEIDWP